jgi:hypothetical protein
MSGITRRIAERNDLRRKVVRRSVKSALAGSRACPHKIPITVSRPVSKFLKFATNFPKRSEACAALLS